MSDYLVSAPAQLERLAGEYLLEHPLCACGTRQLVVGLASSTPARRTIMIEGRRHAPVEVMCQIRYEFGDGPGLDAGARRVRDSHEYAYLGCYPL
jgi:hypothetical protein